MLLNKGTYIYSFEGKDVFNKELCISESKKFKASLDYSLEAIQIQTVADSVYKKKKEKANIFYQVDNKQYTNKIVNLTFKYNEKEYNQIKIKDKEYYVHYKSELDYKSIVNIDFDNGIYIKDDIIQAISVNSECNLKSRELPKGFGVKDNKIYLSKTPIKTISNADAIRKELYVNGFKLKFSNGEEVEYVRFKRSSGASRVGKCLFIDKRLYKDMMEWSLMGLNFDINDKIDLAGLEAYIALTTSSIIDTIEIKPENILIIKDYESTFKDKVMVTKIRNEKYIDKNGEEQTRDRLFTEPDEIEITNSIWDGQSLADSSLFEEKYKDKGMLLLRNRFFKSCCFNCNIQKYFKENNIHDVSQLNGFTLAKEVEDIKLITTPSSIKYLKYGDKEKWLEQLDSCFGIVKYEKPTFYFNGRMVQTHYQLLNTLQLTEKEVESLLKDSIDYVRLLKTDIRVFREHLKLKIKDEIEYGDLSSTDEFMMTMLQLNDKFENTDLFNTFRQDSVKAYIKNMKKGHILINGTYAVLCGNGLEMLKYSCNKDYNVESLLNADEVYCKKFKLNKQLIGSRSPHVTIGNLWLPKNTNCEKASEIDKYFNSSKQIVHITSIKTNVLERLSSADFDSDSLLLSDNELLISKAKVNYDKYLVPTSKVEAKKVQRYNTPEEKCDLDIKTSKNLIGEIINCSQILNSKLWDSLNSKKCKSKLTQEELDSLYAIISQLDVMSCIEIDKAKKEFSIDNQLELDEIRSKYIVNQKKPLFFKFLSKEKGNEIKASKYKKHKTTMDYLIEIINRETKEIRQKYRKGENKVVTFSELLSADKKIKIANACIPVCESIFEESSKTRAKIINVWNNNLLSNEEKFNKTNEFKNDLETFIANKQVSSASIKKIIYDLNSNKIEHAELNKSERLLLSVLYKTHKINFIELFNEQREEKEVLMRIKSYSESNEIIKLYNIPYAIKKVK